MHATSFGFESVGTESGAAAKFRHKQSFVGEDDDALPPKRAGGMMLRYWQKALVGSTSNSRGSGVSARSLLRPVQSSQLIDQDAQEGTSRSLDQFLPSPRQ